MPLNRPALSLGSVPRSVQDARRWVVDLCHDIGREDLVECAELGASELVTNALLHARPPVSVRLRGTREHPRVEVRDGSPEPPVMPGTERPAGEDLMLTFGRGLSIVASCSDSWGVDIEEDGKTIWFAPATRPGHAPVEGLVTGEGSAPDAVPAPDEISIDLLGVPVRSFIEFQRHYRELRREVRLLALAHGPDYPLAKDLSELFAALARDLREGLGSEQVEQAQATGAARADLRVVMPRSTAPTVGRSTQALELADTFCREERMLSLARVPEQRRFQRWLLGELVRQERGEAAEPWQDARVPRAQSSIS